MWMLDLFLKSSKGGDGRRARVDGRGPKGANCRKARTATNANSRRAPRAKKGEGARKAKGRERRRENAGGRKGEGPRPPRVILRVARAPRCATEGSLSTRGSSRSFISCYLTLLTP